VALIANVEANLVLILDLDLDLGCLPESCGLKVPLLLEHSPPETTDLSEKCI
jgi:hypothetical protein